MNHIIKTNKKALLGKGLGPKMRVVCLGPTGEDGITKLVDEATVAVFGRACPGRPQGAAAANDVRRAKKAKKDEAAAGSSSATSDDQGQGQRQGHPWRLYDAEAELGGVPTRVPRGCRHLTRTSRARAPST